MYFESLLVIYRDIISYVLSLHSHQSQFFVFLYLSHCLFFVCVCFSFVIVIFVLKTDKPKFEIFCDKACPKWNLKYSSPFFFFFLFSPFPPPFYLSFIFFCFFSFLKLFLIFCSRFPLLFPTPLILKPILSEWTGNRWKSFFSFFWHNFRFESQFLWTIIISFCSKHTKKTD